MRLIPSLVVLLATVTGAAAATWTVDPAASEIAFNGTHSGRPFKGTFRTWTATIDFDPDIPEAAKIEVVVDLASAKTGDATYDRTLPQKDWLDTTASSKATFATTSVRKGGADNAYEADGTLTIRGTSVPVSLPFTLAIDGDKATMNGQAKLKRLDWAIGKGSDASGSWVSLDIPVDLKVVATKK